MISVEPIPSRSHSQTQYSSRYSTRSPANKANSTSTPQANTQRTGRRHSTVSLSSTRSASRERPKKYVGDYYLGRTLGKGASGTRWYFCHATTSIVARAKKRLFPISSIKTLTRLSGRVKLGIHRVTGEQVAIKIINKAYLSANPAIDKAVKREIAIMKLIHHPSIMSLHDVIEDDESPEL